MKQAVSIADIAKQAGVSTSTVSHVINKTRYVSPEITERVNRIIQETNYQQNLLARALRQNQTRNIGIILPSVNPGNFYGKTLMGIESVLDQHGYRLMTYASHDDPRHEQEAIEQLLAWKVAGLIIVLADNSRDYAKIPCPTVLIEREPNAGAISGFYPDHRSAARSLVLEIAKKGYREIGLICPTPIFYPTVSRVEGYKEGLRMAGLSINEASMRFAKPTQEDGAQSMQYILEHTPTQAVVIASSPMTVGAIHYLNENGIQIPERIGIATFANYEWTPLCNPALCGVKQPNRELGVMAANRLLKHIQGDREIETRRLPCVYLEGKSL